MSKEVQSDGFLEKLSLLLKTGLPLMKNVLKPLAKSILIVLGLKQQYQQQMQEFIKKILGFRTTTMIISNEEMEHIMKKVKPLEDSGLLIKLVTQIIENETKEQRG